MKSLRSLLLVVAIGSVSLLPALAYGQQEVDPDHFDQPATKASIAKPHTPKAVAARHHSQAGHARLASKSHHATARAAS